MREAYKRDLEMERDARARMAQKLLRISLHIRVRIVPPFTSM